MALIIVEVAIRTSGDANVDGHSWDERHSMGLLLEGTIVDTKRSDCIKVDGDWGDLDILEIEGLRELLDITIFTEHTASIIVVPCSDSALNVYVYIGSSMSLSELLQHLYLPLQFSSFYLASTHINKDLSAIQCGINHRVIRNPGLLTNLVSKRGIIEAQDKSTDWDCELSSDFLYDLGEEKVSHISRMLP